MTAAPRLGMLADHASPVPALPDILCSPNVVQQHDVVLRFVVACIAAADLPPAPDRLGRLGFGRWPHARLPAMLKPAGSSLPL